MYQAVFPDPNDPADPPAADPNEDIIDDPIYDDEPEIIDEPDPEMPDNRETDA